MTWTSPPSDPRTFREDGTRHRPGRPRGVAPDAPRLRDDRKDDVRWPGRVVVDGVAGRSPPRLVVVAARSGIGTSAFAPRTGSNLSSWGAGARPARRRARADDGSDGEAVLLAVVYSVERDRGLEELVTAVAGRVLHSCEQRRLFRGAERRERADERHRFLELI